MACTWSLCPLRTAFTSRETRSQIVTVFSQAVRKSLRSGSIMTYLTAEGAWSSAIIFPLSRSQMRMLLVAVEMRKFQWRDMERTPLLWASTFQTQSHRFEAVSPQLPLALCSICSSKAEQLLVFLRRSKDSVIPSNYQSSCLLEACFSSRRSGFTKLGYSWRPMFLSLLTKFLIFWYFYWITSHFRRVFSNSELRCLLFLVRSCIFRSSYLFSRSSSLFKPTETGSGSSLQYLFILSSCIWAKVLWYSAFKLIRFSLSALISSFSLSISLTKFLFQDSSLQFSKMQFFKACITALVNTLKESLWSQVLLQRTDDSRSKQSMLYCRMSERCLSEILSSRDRMFSSRSLTMMERDICSSSSSWESSSSSAFKSNFSFLILKPETSAMRDSSCFSSSWMEALRVAMACSLSISKAICLQILKTSSSCCFWKCWTSWGVSSVFWGLASFLFLWGGLTKCLRASLALLILLISSSLCLTVWSFLQFFILSLRISFSFFMFSFLACSSSLIRLFLILSKASLSSFSFRCSSTFCTLNFFISSPKSLILCFWLSTCFSMLICSLAFFRQSFSSCSRFSILFTNLFFSTSPLSSLCFTNCLLSFSRRAIFWWYSFFIELMTSVSRLICSLLILSRNSSLSKMYRSTSLSSSLICCSFLLQSFSCSWISSSSSTFYIMVVSMSSSKDWSATIDSCSTFSVPESPTSSDSLDSCCLSLLFSRPIAQSMLCFFISIFSSFLLFSSKLLYSVCSWPNKLSLSVSLASKCCTFQRYCSSTCTFSFWLSSKRSLRELMSSPSPSDGCSFSNSSNCSCMMSFSRRMSYILISKSLSLCLVFWSSTRLSLQRRVSILFSSRISLVSIANMSGLSSSRSTLTPFSASICFSLRFSALSSRFSCLSMSFLFLLMTGVFLMFMALLAYLRVFRLSSQLDSAGLTQAIMQVLELPPRASWRIRVSLEFRKVMNWSLFFSMVDNAEITFPSSSSPMLMLIPSLSVSPVAPVFLARSEPARSAKKNRLWVIPVISSSFLSSVLMGSLSMQMVKMAWERELASFMLVCLVVRWVPPLSSSLSICAGVETTSLATPSTLTSPVSLSSLIAIPSLRTSAPYLFLYVGSVSKSTICSLQSSMQEIVTVI